MEPITETSKDQRSGPPDAPAATPSRANNPPAATVASQQLASPAPCPTCGGGLTSQPPSYVWVVGEFGYPPPPRSLGAAMELQRLIGQAETKGKTDREAMEAVLRAPENRHLMWEHCWFLKVRGLVAYRVTPRDLQGLEELIKAGALNPRPTDLVAVVGECGPIAWDCGVMVPTLNPNTIYHARYEEFLASVPRPGKMTAKQFQPTVEQVFMQMTGHTGRSDAERVQAYAALTDTQMYHVVADQFAHNARLSAVEVHRSSSSVTRTVLTLSLAFVEPKTGVTRKFCADFDATDKYLFKATMWAPCYDR